MASKANIVASHLKALAPTRENVFTSILNGVGNALMLAALPTLFLSEQARNTHKNTLYITTGIAVVLGAVYGVHEANQLKKYRTALVDEIGRLGGQVEELKEENKQWQQKITLERVQEKTAEEKSII